ncbi:MULTISPECIES: tRNA (adenosine(37)-N6)-threonylcarbamoyltransferase complex dimerization subunit type 1 TsaB [Mesotoga]|mgnify:CR=1 FL=1|jgi:tRNA threonylcarbamoyl adenosine modification protein YeaZ|uniref:Universal bacterial protein YeaZ n=1 Tax=Mesotoga prima MesG1.Ag.4.2 TaxID=660470 RepID=I2F5G0_9BACT|nr:MULTISPECIES: tRNA (adenosine(37)-N6)-threonylcarbamoyltransferase complex dimerization subunit type 1 TsaB [Mesotoga]MCP5457142.1 tRNA (adenosine(37)-N6)-threonylcarbamoyltransferase complex dimerization subunit type 1 TsaB [Thermotogota bacterium]CCU83837.1 Peptidase M22 glycoprotease [Mesotoga infera]AFK07163.1 universal bacterial protein YeaZ [Mesotoga prima MesG1.Ag.4.2]MCB1222962.1 tRNA (adenosine(37)-N6)-threonylcarbamoyltransferase complex dimerization subunit type 1 TsaB [Mesotoga s
MKYICFDTSSRTLLLSAVSNAAEMDIRCRDIDRYGSMLAVIMRQAIENLKIDVSELEFVGVGIGPGSLTGLRVGISTAKGLAFPHGIPAVPFNSLDVLAKTVDSDRYLILRKAREDHYYWREYKGGLPVGNTGFSNTGMIKSKIELSTMELFFDGEIDPEFEDFRCSLVKNYDPSSMREIVLDTYASGNQVSCSDLAPIYLQKSIAEINWEKRSNEKES